MPVIRSVEQTIAARGVINGGPRARVENNALAIIGDSGESIAKFEQQKADQAEKLRQANFMVDSQLSWEKQLNDLKQEYPEGTGYTERVKQEFEEFSQESLGNVSPRYRDEFAGQLLNLKQNVMGSAMRDEANIKAAYQINKFEDELNVLANRARADGYVDQALYDAVEKKIDLYDVSPEVKIKIRDKLNNDVASSYIQGLIENNPAAAVAELKSPEYQGLLDSNIYNSLLNRAEATQKAGEIRVEKMKFTDPAAYDIAQDPSLAMDPASLVESQRARGVPASDISVMPKEQSKSLVTGIKKVENVDQFITFKQGLKDQYGDYYDLAVKDLYKGGLPIDYQLMFSMDETQNVDQMNAMMRVVQGGGSLSSNKNSVIAQAKDKAVVDGSSFETEIKTPVLKEMADTMGFLAAENMPDIYRQNLSNSVVAMASAFYTGGDAADVAVDKATGWITNSYEKKSVNGVEYRLPVSDEYDPDELHGALVRELGRVKIEFPVTEQKAKNYLTTIKNTGHFVTNPEQTGVYLVAADGSNVVDKYASVTDQGIFVPARDAKIIEFNFEQVFLNRDLNNPSYKGIREDGKRLGWSEGRIRKAIDDQKMIDSYEVINKNSWQEW